MANRTKRGSYFENHQSAELSDGPAHAHTVGELHGKQDHLTATEHSKQEFEREQEETRHSHASTVGHGIAAFGHDEIAEVAHQRWVERGRPEGSAEEDWFEAVKQLRSRASVRA